MLHSYVLAGLRLRSEVPLPDTRPSREAGAVDFTVTLEEAVRPATTATPDGTVLLDFETDQRWYTLVRSDDGRYLFRIYGVCEFTVSADLASVNLTRHADMTPGMEPIMIAGTLVALQLYLRGHLVLHASAVELGGAAIGFLGHSGMGKSTLATLLCAGADAAVITDDVLRVDLPAGRAPTARLGASELRLRPGAASLSDWFGTDAAVRTSADRRQVVRPAREAVDHLPLRALVIPRPDRDADDVEVMRLPARDAVLAVLSFPRLMGWREPDVLNRTFAGVGALVGAVPVLAVQVPWGPPFAPDLPARLRAGLNSVLLE